MRGMRTLIVAVGLLAIAAAACGGGKSSVLDSIARTKTAESPAACAKEDANDAIDDIDPLANEFSDAFARAQAASRITLSPIVSDMQRIVRDLNKLDVAKCAESTRFAISTAYAAITDAILAFQAGEETSGKFDRSSRLMTTATERLRVLRNAAD